MRARFGVGDPKELTPRFESAMGEQRVERLLRCKGVFNESMGRLPPLTVPAPVATGALFQPLTFSLHNLKRQVLRTQRVHVQPRFNELQPNPVLRLTHNLPA